jgi:acyl-coenzyme A synthetase/AMP-(fatty) acid ligase
VILAPDDRAAVLPAGETGSLAVHRSDPGLMLGYWRDPEATAAPRGRWFVGGDLAELDPDGYVWHHGRQDDILNCQGYRVFALEVERVMAGHSAVAEVAVGEGRRADGPALLTAYVVPAGAAPMPEELQAWAAERLAACKRPKLISFLPSLPRTADGKLIRARLHEVSEEERQAAAARRD